MRADVRNQLSPLRRPAAAVCLLAALTCLGIGPPASAQPAATDQYVEEQPTGPGTDIGTGAAPNPAPEPTPPAAEPPPTPVEPPEPEPSSAATAPERRPAEGSTPPSVVHPSTPAPAAIPVAEDDGGSGTLWLGGYGVTPFVFCVAAVLAACLLWRLGTAGAARLRAG